MPVLHSLPNPRGRRQLSDRFIEHRQNLLAYLVHRGKEPATVIIGASTAQILGEDKANNLFNISLGGTSVRDHKRMLRYCRDIDTVLYPVTFCDIAFKDYPGRSEIFQPTLQYPRMLKEHMRNYILGPPEYDGAFIRHWQISLFSRKTPMDIVPLIDVAGGHQRVIFVLSPIASVTAEMVEVHSAFELAMESTGYPVINLSHAIPKDGFPENDVLHCTQESSLMVRQMILDAIAAAVPNGQQRYGDHKLHPRD